MSPDSSSLDKLETEQDEGTSPDSSAQIEINRLRKARRERIEENTKLRRQYAEKAYRFLVAWTFFAGAVFALSRFILPFFDVSDQVLMTLIGGTTIAVISVFHSVIKGLFPLDKPE